MASVSEHTVATMGPFRRQISIHNRASAENEIRLWFVQTGKCLFVWELPMAVKRVSFSDDDEQIVCITEQRMGHQGDIRIFDVHRDGDGTVQSIFHPIESKVTVCAFPQMQGLILTSHESGKFVLFDACSSEEVLSNELAHMDVVTDLQLSADRPYFIPSSKDKTACIHDTQILTVLKTFSTETLLNSAALAPNMPHVLLGGGQEAMSVTMTSLQQATFEACFQHRIFKEEIG